MIILNRIEDLTGYTLLIPAVSVGNVGQLTVDLYLSSLDCKELGHVWHPAILPAVGANPFGDLSKSLSTGCQIYKEDSQKLVLFQFRAPVLNRHVQDLLDKLLVWIKSSKFAKVVVLTGSTFTEGCDSLICGDKLRYLLTKDLYEVNRNAIEDMRWTEAPSHSGKVFMPSSGYARSLFAMLDAAGVPAAVVIKYCAEGNNIPDALELANYLNDWMRVVKNDGQWKQPPSWKHMYGNLPDVKRIF